MLHRGTTGEMGWSIWWRGLKTFLKGTQLVTGALFPPFLHQEKFNPMTFCSQYCIAMLEAIYILFWMRGDREHPSVYSPCNPALSHQGVFNASVPQWDLKGQRQSFRHMLITFIICPSVIIILYWFSSSFLTPRSASPWIILISLPLLLSSLLSSIYFSLSLFLSSHTYSWCSNSQSIRCPKHIKYGSTCNHACWKFIVLQHYLDTPWGVSVLPRRHNSGNWDSG